MSGPPGRARLTRGLALAALVVAGTIAGVLLIRGSSSGEQAVAPTTGLGRAVSRADLQRDYGIRLNLVGVTAAGGLVDLRFTVTDAAKARKLFTSDRVMPAVVSERSGKVLTPPHGGHHGHISPVSGASYFVLIGNEGGTVQKGVPVSVVINGVRVEHIPAEA